MSTHLEPNTSSMNLDFVWTQDIKIVIIMENNIGNMDNAIFKGRSRSLSFFPLMTRETLALLSCSPTSQVHLFQYLHAKHEPTS